MRGLVSMRLFRTLCPKCKEQMLSHPRHPAYRRVMDAFGEVAMRQIYVRGKGCELCDKKGFAGRVKAGEIIITDNEFLRRALGSDAAGAIKYWLEELDGRTLKEAAIELMLKGLIDPSELERWVGLLDQVGIY